MTPTEKVNKFPDEIHPHTEHMENEILVTLTDLCQSDEGESF
jgi:hypothetical protein